MVVSVLRLSDAINENRANNPVTANSTSSGKNDQFQLTIVGF